MWTTSLVICLVGLTAHLDARIIGLSSGKPLYIDLKGSKSHLLTKESPFNMDQALAKISDSCLTGSEHARLLNNLTKNRYSPSFLIELVAQAIQSISEAEIRAALGLSPIKPWTHYKVITNEEMDAMANATAEQYLEFYTRNQDRSLDSEVFLEKDFDSVITFLDERFPEIRQIFKFKTAEFARLKLNKKEIDRLGVSQVFNEYIYNIMPKLTEAMTKCVKAMYLGKF